MGTRSDCHKVNLIVGLLSSDPSTMKRAQDMLTGKYGPSDFESDIFEFTHSDYYKPEMGSGLKRRFISFRDPVKPQEMAAVKIVTNNMELELSRDNKRAVNIDPGYLDLAKLVLLSTKDFTHRIYLDNGIYAEVTLYYKDRRFNPWPWTYPDYKSDVYLDVFEHIRELYRKKNI